MRTRRFQLNPITLVGVLGLSSAFACAHAAPQELVDAREAYRRAEGGPASRLAPAELDTAQKALTRAETMFHEHPTDATTRDWAYVAQRKAQLADVKAGTELSNEQKVSGQKNVETAMKDKITSTKEELADSRQENQDAKSRSAEEWAETAKTDLADSKNALETEKKARITAEEENRDLTESLAKVAKVTEEDRGTVISLSGSVLFASGQSTLLPGSSTTLDNVALALNKRRDQMITVEGHTDSIGSDSLNQMLSVARAQAVRDYLIGRGVLATRLTAIGLGKTRPIADNATAEGRANNRRVEIVLSPNRS